MEIICIGDSLTYGYGVRRAQRWTELASEMSGWQLTNHGVCGDTTGGMLVRMREILREVHGRRDERCFLLMGGCNDIFFSGSSLGAQENMAAMVHQLFAAGEMPIVAIGPGIAECHADNPWVNAVDFPAASECIRKYFAWLDRFCSTFGVRMIDFRDDFRNAEKCTREDLYLDGLHPNTIGHQIMAERVCKVISVMEREKMNA
ncbi:MAG: hypothetical protein IJG40_09470 [Oscillospiraceae bacterium]|nr:hypothetical protein [Oscillospiraceae bacterium]